MSTTARKYQALSLLRLWQWSTTFFTLLFCCFYIACLSKSQFWHTVSSVKSGSHLFWPVQSCSVLFVHSTAFKNVLSVLFHALHCARSVLYFIYTFKRALLWEGETMKIIIWDATRVYGNLSRCHLSSRWCVNRRPEQQFLLSRPRTALQNGSLLNYGVSLEKPPKENICEQWTPCTHQKCCN